MLCVDDGCYAALLLRLGDGKDGERGLSRLFRAVDFNDTSAGIAAHAECVVKSDDA